MKKIKNITPRTQAAPLRAADINNLIEVKSVLSTMTRKPSTEHHVINRQYILVANLIRFTIFKIRFAHLFENARLCIDTDTELLFEQKS